MMQQLSLPAKASAQAGWHTKTIPEILNALRSREHGLTKEEAERRLQEYGPNKLPEGKVDSLPVIFLRQFQSPLIYILLAAATIVFAMKEIIDGSVILAVLLFNAIVGTIQEGKAQNVILALKKFAETSATVMRDGKELILSDIEVAPGDIIILQEGEKVPADARIIFANNLKIDEASLTGESEPVAKTDTVLSADHLPVADRKNMIFKGTNVLSGSGTAVVAATGMTTEIGKIAQKIAAIDTEIPLKTNIRHLSQLIIITVITLSVLLFALGALSGKPLKEMFTIVIALAVSIIPEGLPIVMTLILATGVLRMSKRHVLVKRLQAVEALGQTKVIAVDKTGTLTKNEMVIQRVFVDGKIFEITGSGYEPKGEVILDGNIINPLNHQELIFSGKIAAFCANARLSFLPSIGREESGAWKIAGDPTEAAMLVLSEKIGFQRNALERETPKIFELPFDYRRKYHTTIRAVNGKKFLTIVGAPEKVLGLCKEVWLKNKAEALGEEKIKELESAFQKLAQDGFRVVAFAINPDVGPSVDPDAMPSLAFVGFFGMKDALRPEVEEAVQRVRAAEMRVVMITGDHRLTAQAVAKEADIYQEGDLVLTGEEIDMMSDDELAGKLARATVFARVTPDHKLRIIQAFRKRGEIVAMTGDGVNDAPSLVAADLGVAMGKIGTEVAKEASDIVLLDDNFASIVSAAEEGRHIYKIVQKALLFLFSTAIGEVLIITTALILGFFIGLPLPLLAVQILWVNLVGDGILGIFFAYDPKESNLLSARWRKPSKYIVNKSILLRLPGMVIIMAAGTLIIFWIYWSQGDYPKAITMAFTTLAMFQWFNAWNCRSESASLFTQNPLRNPLMLTATVGVVFLQLLVIYHPFMQKVFRTTPLLFSEWLLVASIALSIVLVEEIRKFFYRKKSV